MKAVFWLKTLNCVLAASRMSHSGVRWSTAGVYLGLSQPRQVQERLGDPADWKPARNELKPFLQKSEKSAGWEQTLAYVTQQQQMASGQKLEEALSREDLQNEGKISLLHTLCRLVISDLGVPSHRKARKEQLSSNKPSNK